MDELFVGEGYQRRFQLFTTSHPEETLEDVVQFARTFSIDGVENQEIKIIQV